MRWFSRRRSTLFPADILRRLELLGRYSIDPQHSGVEADQIWSPIVAPLIAPAQRDPAAFLTELAEVAAAGRGGFATYGAAALVWEVLGREGVTHPAARPIVDAGIDFKLALGLSRLHLTGYENDRLYQRSREQEEGM